MINRRTLKDSAKRVLVSAHRTALKIGLVILPNHYYTSIADLNDLDRTRSRWARRSSMLGIGNNLTDQGAALRTMVSPYGEEYWGNKSYKEATDGLFGPGFGYVEAQCLHGVIRSLKPRRILEVGSGVSTYCSIKASLLNGREGSPTEITCIEPFPSRYLVQASERHEVSLISAPVQTVDPKVFLDLEAGDLLFIDSTHAIKPGGDVLFLYLEILPRLRAGVYVHIHDIYFPYLYQRDLLHSFYQWSETAILQALLTNNDHLSILFCLSNLAYDAPEIISDVFPEFTPQAAHDGLVAPGTSGHFPSSIYLQTK